LINILDSKLRTLSNKVKIVGKGG